jgi:hypothetical protein
MHEWQYIKNLIAMNNFADITLLESCIIKRDILTIIRHEALNIHILYHADCYLLLLSILPAQGDPRFLFLLCHEPLVVRLFVNTNYTILGRNQGCAGFCASFDFAHNQSIVLNHWI